MEKDFSVDVPAADIRYDDNRDTITSIFPTKYFTETHEVEYDEKDIAPGTKLNLFAELTVDNYHALVETGICLKREEDLDSSCSNNEVVTSSQLGRQTTYLPVAIDRIEKVATPLSDNNYFVNLKITFKNLGGGTIFQPGSEEERFEQVMDAPTVALPVTTEGEIKCSPSKLVFENNAASLNCFLNLAAGETYVTYPLRIGYDFGYKMRIKQGSIPLVKISEIERTLEG